MPYIEPRPWLRAFAWLGFLAPFFFVTYLGSLEIVSWREHVPTLVFDWEKHIPFLAWTIVPYWSIDFLYGLAIFLCATRFELNRLGMRLLSAQVIAVMIFLIAPLQLTSTIPAETGIFAPLFAALAEVVSKPYNLAPSLHIALLIILWVHYARHIPIRWHVPMHIWAALIGISVLTTNQHHFFDVPTGAALGFFCLWLWPERGPSPLKSAQVARDTRRWKLAAIYSVGAGACLTVAVMIGGWFLWLLWPALSLILVALAYALFGAALFQKTEEGTLSIASRWLLWPYLMAARINAALWAQRIPEPVEIAPRLFLGRVPSLVYPDLRVIDVSAELQAPARADAWVAYPMLDLVAPSPRDLCAAAKITDDTYRGTQTDVRICCALGLSRSAATAAVWLATYGGMSSVQAAIDHLRTMRPETVLSRTQIKAIETASHLLHPPDRVSLTLSERDGAAPHSRSRPVLG